VIGRSNIVGQAAGPNLLPGRGMRPVTVARISKTQDFAGRLAAALNLLFAGGRTARGWCAAIGSKPGRETVIDVGIKPVCRVRGGKSHIVGDVAF